ncbi:HAUS augmin-like complex subunit 6 [Powellomyces hirtus]|nr:HAUS augmin-like complex subunit 6 [Powellomyces hirtus]
MSGTLNVNDALNLRNVFWGNLLLLQFEPQSYVGIQLHSEIFAGHAGSSKAMEVIVHFLFETVDPRGAKEKFAKCWPIVDRGHGREFRVVVVKWFEALRKDGKLPADISVRKSHFDECRGER